MPGRHQDVRGQPARGSTNGRNYRMTTITPDTVSVEFTRDELRTLYLHFYGTDFSDISSVFQSACDKIVAAQKEAAK
jgi:hypothetical protein